MSDTTKTAAFRIDPADMVDEEAQDKAAAKRAFQVARRVLGEGGNHADFRLALREANLKVIDW